MHIWLANAVFLFLLIEKLTWNWYAFHDKLNPHVKFTRTDNFIAAFYAALLYLSMSV